MHAQNTVLRVLEEEVGDFYDHGKISLRQRIRNLETVKTGQKRNIS